MRLIDADALKKALEPYRYSICGFEGVLALIDAADTLPGEGEWINHRNDYGHNIADCSLCGKTMQWHDEDEDGIPKYCWYCGAPMKGVKNDYTEA